MPPNPKAKPDGEPKTPETVKKAKILAAKRSTSISGLLAAQIEDLV